MPWIFGLAPCRVFISRSQHGCGCWRVFFANLDVFVWQAVKYFPRITPSQSTLTPPQNVNVQSVNESVKVVKYFCQNCEIYLSRQAAPDFPGIAPSHSTKPPTPPSPLHNPPHPHLHHTQTRPPFLTTHQPLPTSNHIHHRSQEILPCI